MLDIKGQTCSLENNLIASLKGCKIPIKPTLLGPLRIWMYPKSLRSNKVRKAILIKTPKTKIKKFKIINI